MVLTEAPFAMDEQYLFELNNGCKIPGIGLGTWRAPPGLVGDAVRTALELGYRHLDCAAAYGNESEIGIELQKCFKEGIVKRDELWITSKLRNTHHAPEDVSEALETTLNNLQLKYLDLYLIHWPVAYIKGHDGSHKDNYAPLNIEATWKAMEDLVACRKVRSIGVSNFSIKKLDHLLSHANIVPAVLQVELHPVWQQPKLRAFCASKGIHVSGYCPLGAPGSSFATVSVLDHPVMIKVAKKLGKSTAQVALRWGLQSGHSILPKSTNVDRIRSNLEIFDWSIPEEDMQKIAGIEPQVRFLRSAEMCNGPYYKSVEELWDYEI